MLVVEPVISVSEDHQSLFELISFPVCHLSLAGAKYHCFAYHLLRYTAETCKELCIHIFGWHCWQHSKLIASFSRYCKLKRRQLTLFKLVLFWPHVVHVPLESVSFKVLRWKIYGVSRCENGLKAKHAHEKCSFIWSMNDFFKVWVHCVFSAGGVPVGARVKVKVKVTGRSHSYYQKSVDIKNVTFLVFKLWVDIFNILKFYKMKIIYINNYL